VATVALVVAVAVAAPATTEYVAKVAVVVAVAVAAAVAADAAAMVAAVTVAADVSAMAEDHPAGATATVSSAPSLLQLGPINGYAQHHSTHQRRFPRRVSLRHFGNLPPTHAKSGRLGGAISHAKLIPAIPIDRTPPTTSLMQLSRDINTHME
jgi:hypothetical protein